MGELPRLIWMLVDGLPFWLLDRFRRADALPPTLARLFDEGGITELAPIWPNCQTPPSLFTLFSGLPPTVHGLSGFDLPDRRDPLAKHNGFNGFPRDIPMVWDRYASAGQTIRLCQVPFVDAAGMGSHLLSASYGFGAPALAPRLIEGLAIGRQEIWPEIGVTCVIAQLTPAAVTLRLEPTGDRVTIARDGWEPIGLPDGLSTLAGLVWRDGEPVLIVLGAWREARAGCRPAPDFAKTPFVGGGVADLFRRGAFGRIAIDGGDGTAERAFVGAIRAIGRRYWVEAIHAQASADADFILAYQPAYDLLFHELLGLIDRSSRFHRPEIAALAESLILTALGDLDAGLAALLAGESGERLFLASDHGMKPVDTVLLPNAVLAQLGLAATDRAAIDPARSVAFFHPAETGLVCMHADRLQAHGLTPADVMDRLVDAFTEAAPCPADWFAVDLPEVGPAGYINRYYLSPGSGQTMKADIGPQPTRRARKSADHATTSHDPQLRGVVAALAGGAAMRLPRTIEAADVLPVMMGPAR